MRTKPLFIGSFLISFLLFTINIASYAQTCATCPGNTVTGIKASAFGDGNTASGNYSFVAGRSSEASKHNAVVIGSYSKATGLHSYVVGSNSFATGNFSYAFGGNSKAEMDFSMAIGHNIVANLGGFALGVGKVDALLTNNKQESLVIGFNSAYPTLFVSRTPIDQQSGRVGIGNITAPQAKLHILADEGEDASLLLETSSIEQFSRLQFSEDHEIKTRAEDNFHFSTKAETDFVFHQGNIFIEDIQKGVIMRSPDGQCWLGKVNNQGMLTFEQTTCPDGATSQPETVTPAKQLKVYPNPADGYVEVHTGKLSGKLALCLMDANGKQLLEQQAQAGKNILKLDGLQAGAYILMLKKDGLLIESEKLVVK